MVKMFRNIYNTMEISELDLALATGSVSQGNTTDFLLKYCLLNPFQQNMFCTIIYWLDFISPIHLNEGVKLMSCPLDVLSP